MRWTVGTVFLLVWALLSLLNQPGIYIDDEIGQAASVISKWRGHVGVSGDVPQVFHELGWGDTRGGLVPEPGDEVADSGSALLAVMSLPAYAVILAFGAFVGTAGAGALMATLPTLALVARRWPGHGCWQRRPVTFVAVAIVVNLLLALMGPQPDRHAYVEVLAIQATIGLVVALGAALLWDVAQRRWVAGWVALAALAATPALFWALNIKYHGLMLGWVLIAIWLYQDGWRTGPLRTGLTFAVVGLALSTHFPNGVLLAVSTGLMALPAITLGVRPLLARAGAGVAGLAIGVLPDWWESRALLRIEASDRHFVARDAVDQPATVPELVEGHNDGGRLSQAAWNEPLQVLEATLDALFFIPFEHDLAGGALPMLVVAPFAVAAAWRLRRSWPEPLTAWAVLHLVAVFGLFGVLVFNNGAGFDLRQASTAWPFVVVLATPGLAVAWRRHGWRPVASGAGLLVVIGAIQLVMRRLVDVWAADWVHVYSLSMIGMAAGYLVLGLIAWAAGRDGSLAGPWSQRMWLVAAGMGLAWQVVLQFTLARATTSSGDPVYGVVPLRLVEAIVEWYFVSW